MAKLIYSALASVDGYVSDEAGNFDWAAPGEELHAFVNDLERPIGTYLFGRRMYDAMVVWETLDPSDRVSRDFAEIWHGAEKIVYSRTLEAARSAHTRIERTFDPEAVRRLKSASARDLTIGGPELAGQAIAAGLVDEIHLFLNPVLVGGGTPALPRDVRLDLAALAQRGFPGGVAYLHYRVEG